MSSSESLRMRALLRAREVCGGHDQLAAYLRISGSRLSAIVESGAVPDAIFMQVMLAAHPGDRPA